MKLLFWLSHGRYVSSDRKNTPHFQRSRRSDESAGRPPPEVPVPSLLTLSPRKKWMVTLFQKLFRSTTAILCL
jgi:hypothetical protein